VKIFLDTANLDEIRRVHAWGILDGVTTNPSLIAKEGRSFLDTIHEICELVQGPVSAEVVAQDPAGMIEQGRLLARVHEHVVVKVPLTAAGLAATRALSDEGIRTNVTLCFQPNQALLAAKAGATYISPFVGRIDDVSGDGMEVVAQIVSIYANYPELHTQVLAASIRHPKHLVDAALAGAHVATCPYKVLVQALAHPQTDQGNEKFLEDWATVPDRDITRQATEWLAQRGR
jgi:transaldolase